MVHDKKRWLQWFPTRWEDRWFWCFIIWSYSGSFSDKFNWTTFYLQIISWFCFGSLKLFYYVERLHLWVSVGNAAGDESWWTFLTAGPKISSKVASNSVATNCWFDELNRSQETFISLAAFKPVWIICVFQINKSYSADGVEINTPSRTETRWRHTLSPSLWVSRPSVLFSLLRCRKIITAGVTDQRAAAALSTVKEAGGHDSTLVTGNWKAATDIKTVWKKFSSRRPVYGWLK